MSINDVPSQELITKAAQELRKTNKIIPPAWAPFVKTGANKERPPVDENWWFTRTAAVLRKVILRGPLGVQKLRAKYGGKRNRGMAKERYYKGSGSIIRNVLQQLEKAGYIKQDQKGVRKGRVATPQGISFMDGVAQGMLKEAPAAKPSQK